MIYQSSFSPDLAWLAIPCICVYTILSNFCLFIKVASVMGGRMGSNLLTEGGGKGAGCVFILLIILEAALDKINNQY